MEQILIQNKETCIINGGRTTNYFEPEKFTREGDPISAYLFILVLEITFLFIMKNESINCLNIFEKKTLLQTAYTDDTTFFLKTKNLL